MANLSFLHAVKGGSKTRCLAYLSYRYHLPPFQPTIKRGQGGQTPQTQTLQAWHRAAFYRRLREISPPPLLYRFSKHDSSTAKTVAVPKMAGGVGTVSSRAFRKRILQVRHPLRRGVIEL
ncbi:unnamed protein product [Ectocarpus sp. 8 AP-2014]